MQINLRAYKHHGFNTQPPEGGCLNKLEEMDSRLTVSTHSHPKVAAPVYLPVATVDSVSTHSHPKVAAPYIKKQEKSAN